MIALSNVIRVNGLDRKCRVGASFTINAVGNPAKGFATVLRRAKNGQITARLDTDKSLFTFSAKNITVWAHKGK